MSDIRYFIPKRTDTLNGRCRPWIGQRVTVRSWHQNTAMLITHPEDERVGFVVECAADIPESELSMSPPTHPIVVDPPKFEMLQYLEEHGNLDGARCPGCGMIAGTTEASRVPLPALVAIADHRSIEATCRFCEWKMEVDRG